MNTVKYYTLGSRSEKEGLTLMTALVNDEGEPVAGYDIEKMYKPQEITEAEYNSLKEEMRDPQTGRLGIAGGLINDEGFAAIEALNIRIITDLNVMNYEEAKMLYAKFKKLQQLEISTVVDEIKFSSISKKVNDQINHLITIDSLSEEDAAAVWGILNSTQEELMVATPLPEGSMLGLLNRSSEFTSSMTNAEYCEKIVELRYDLYLKED